MVFCYCVGNVIMTKRDCEAEVSNFENECVGETKRERERGYFPVAQLSSLQTFPALATENNAQENSPTWTQRVDCNTHTHPYTTTQTKLPKLLVKKLLTFDPTHNYKFGHWHWTLVTHCCVCR